MAFDSIHFTSCFVFEVWLSCDAHAGFGLYVYMVIEWVILAFIPLLPVYCDIMLQIVAAYQYVFWICLFLYYFLSLSEKSRGLFF